MKGVLVACGILSHTDSCDCHLTALRACQYPAESKSKARAPKGTR